MNDSVADSTTNFPPTRYGLALAILLALTALSFGAAHVNLGRAAIPIALAIAATKMGVVLTRFMHIGREQTTAKAGLVLAVTMLLLLAAFVCLEASLRASFAAS